MTPGPCQGEVDIGKTGVYGLERACELLKAASQARTQHRIVLLSCVERGSKASVPRGHEVVMTPDPHAGEVT